MKLVLLGVSGAGKGTQAKNLSRHFGIVHISTGDMLREHIRLRTDIGMKIQGIIDSGNLVDDDLMVEIVRKKIAGPECEKGYILDGFPRTINQAHVLSRIVNIDRAIYVMVEDHIVIDRLTGRWVCPSCGEMYHTVSLPPKQAGICDLCGTKLIQRDDDNAETVKDRLKIFHELTEPIINYYRQSGILLTVSGVGNVGDITDNVIKGLKI